MTGPYHLVTERNAASAAPLAATDGVVGAGFGKPRAQRAIDLVEHHLEAERQSGGNRRIAHVVRRQKALWLLRFENRAQASAARAKQRGVMRG